MSTPPDGKTESRRLAAENAPSRPRPDERAATGFGNVRSQKMSHPAALTGVGSSVRTRASARDTLILAFSRKGRRDPLTAIRT